MFKDLFIAIAAGVIGTLPIQPPPAVVVTTDNVESSVVQYIDNHESRTVTVDCSFDDEKISVKEKEPQNFTCLTTDTENKETFTTKIILSAVNGKIDISAVLDKVVKEPTKDSTTPEKK
jgi:hypothetical protein